MPLKFFKFFGTSRAAIWFLAVVVTISANLSLLVRASEHLPNDWGYFNSLSLVVRSIVWNYKTLPFQNPWVCGGLDILTNPQSRVFSPMLLMDLFLAPQLANILSILMYGCIGFLGMYFALRKLNCRYATSLLGATMFICSNWFALHFYEGHIAFGAIQILPLVLLALLEFDRPLVVIVTVLASSIVLLDGGVNAVIFSVFFGLSLVAMVPDCRAKFFQSLSQQKRIWFAALCGGLLLTLPKTFPVLLAVAKRAPVLDFYNMTLRDVSQSLFNPFQSIFDRLPSMVTGYRFHEFGCYVSLVCASLILGAVVTVPGFLSKNRGWLAGVALWFWVGSGWGEAINPWRIVHNVPLLNNAHVQSRVFLIMYIFVVIAFARAFDELRSRSQRFNWVIPLLFVEAIVVRNFAAFTPSNIEMRLPRFADFIDSSSIVRTVPYAFHVSHYLEHPNTGSSQCYEPSFEPVWIKPSADPRYKGEIWMQPPMSGVVSLTKVIPGRIEFDYQTVAPAVIRLNINALFGWDVVEGHGDTSGVGTDIFTFKPEGPTHEHVTLVYRPIYLKIVLFGFGLGVTVFCYLLARLRNESRSKV